MTAISWTTARRHLTKSDPVLAEVIRRVGPCTLKPDGDPFRILVGSVVSQLISTAAARTVNARLETALGDAGITPTSILALDRAKLRGVGLSEAKTNSIREVAERAKDDRLPLARLATATDAEIEAWLMAIRGIGPWTVTMFLIFCLGRPDILPVGDFGLRGGVRDLYKLEGLPGAKDLRQRGEVWRPWRSIATWYIWRSRGPVGAGD